MAVCRRWLAPELLRAPRPTEPSSPYSWRMRWTLESPTAAGKLGPGMGSGAPEAQQPALALPSAEDRLVGDVLGDHRLAEALGRDEDEGAAGSEEVQGARCLDGGAVNPGGPGPIESGHRGEAADPTAQPAAFQAAAGAFRLFDLDEVFDELGRAPTTRGRQRDQVVQVRGGVMEPEELQGLTQRCHRGRPAASVC
jgi:hypothetical protein